MNARVVTFGEIMMRLTPPNDARFTQTNQLNILYAGSEANVAASLAVMGVSSEHVTCFPDNDLGKAATMELRRYGVLTNHIAYQPGRLGLYFVESGASIRSPKIVYDRFDSCFANLDPADFNWDEILEGAEWFHWSGITPAISETAAIACREAIRAARKNGVRVSGDINYRRNLWQYGKSAIDVMPELIEGCDLVIAGITDFENCLGISGSSLEDACQKVVKEYPIIKKVATTKRSTIDSSTQKLSGILWNRKETLESEEYTLSPIVDRIGAGDAFMAGIAFGYLNKMDDQQTLEFATAACALKHTVEGDVNLTTPDEVAAIVRGENIGKLLR